MVMALSGDIGLRDVFTARPEEVTAVPVRVHPPDVDTADDLAQLEAEARLGS
jgi:CTP:molybdopterin cytidylyltransferase MocA